MVLNVYFESLFLVILSRIVSVIISNSLVRGMFISSPISDSVSEILKALK